MKVVDPVASGNEADEEEEDEVDLAVAAAEVVTDEEAEGVAREEAENLEATELVGLDDDEDDDGSESLRSKRSSDCRCASTLALACRSTKPRASSRRSARICPLSAGSLSTLRTSTPSLIDLASDFAHIDSIINTTTDTICAYVHAAVNLTPARRRRPGLMLCDGAGVQPKLSIARAWPLAAGDSEQHFEELIADVQSTKEVRASPIDGPICIRSLR